ncbi:bifunctional folylpolyglutamate synthase/dihydrofolate synthase [Anaerostipes sp.]|uniref:bifunctional folylpolyglutamate synthase/dihydrofolate synthase n=1 Tax=Anaerostipes sp. TaxID=1872530 RepID=UPI0025C61858|nr:folylpolyglutamate synthase/dihydrofolate synthase family protein [Anaerostipes sp.]MBS7007663.1 bifunctional folylpolyglutamate synthase/dihydrofolate synthase [Anaerostipes sp.]
MNYQETMEFIGQANKFGSVLGLDNIRELLKRLGNPQDQLKIVHIAGTNGKGSTLAFLSSVFKEQGYEAGRYVSPASFCYEERFRINDQIISKDDLCFYMEKIKKVSKEMVRDQKEHPTVFEMETALSFLYFLDKKVDVVLLETGLGGRLDATNVITEPLCTMIASIGFDHTQYLGNTLREIAGEKAGIMKKGCPCVSYYNAEEANEVITEKAEQMNAPLTFVDPSRLTILSESLKGAEFSYTCSDGTEYRNMEIRLLGRHQIYNAVTALEALQILKKSYLFLQDSIREGFKNAAWDGRLQRISAVPAVFCDGAHNPDGAERLLQFLQKNFTNKKIIYIMGVLSDKDYPQMLKIMSPMSDEIYTVTPESDRALPAKELALAARPYYRNVTECGRLGDCYPKIRDGCGQDEVIVVFGTLSFLKELRG